MFQTVQGVYLALFVTVLYCGTCTSLINSINSVTFKITNDVDDLLPEVEEVSIKVPEEKNHDEFEIEKPAFIYPDVGETNYKSKTSGEDAVSRKTRRERDIKKTLATFQNVKSKRRVLRQANSLYPQLPTQPPYNPYPNYNQPGHNPIYNSSGQNSFGSNNFGSNSSPYNQYNGQYPSYNVTQKSSYNPTPSSQYPSYNNTSKYPPYSPGYNNNNNTIYRPPSNQFGQYHPTSPPYSPGYRPYNNTSSYNPSQRPPYSQPGQYPLYNNTSNYPPYSPGYNNNNLNYRPSSNQTGQYHPASPPYSPGYRPYNNTSPYNPSQRPPYSQAGQYPNNYPSNPNQAPGNSYSIVYNNSTTQKAPYYIPGQYPSYNASRPSYPTWPATNTAVSSGGSSFNYLQHPQQNNRPIYSPNNQSNQFPNKYIYPPPYNPPYNNFNVSTQSPPYYPPSNGYNAHNNNYPQSNPYYPSNGQHPTYNNTNYATHNNPGYKLGGPYNPTIPDRPPNYNPDQNHFYYPPNNNVTQFDYSKIRPEHFSK